MAQLDFPSSNISDQRLTPRLIFFAVALLGALGILGLLRCMNAPFSDYDDMVFLVNNKLIASDRGWFEVFEKPYQSIYIPLTLITYRLQVLLVGTEEGVLWTYRLVNVLIHVGSGLFLLLLLIELGLRRAEALFVAAVWTVHPLAGESVAWITQRHSCMAMFFGILGFWGYVRWHAEWRGILFGAGFFFLALMSKPSALSFLPLFLAFEFLGGGARLSMRPNEWEREKSNLPNSAGMAFRILPLILLAFLFAGLGIRFGAVRLMPPPGGTWYTALMTDTDIFLRYIGHAIYPLKISAFYAVQDIRSLADPRLNWNLFLLVTAVGFTIWQARSRRRAIFGWIWFFGALGPNANLIGITFSMQDRYLYISLAGLFLVAVEAVTGLLERSVKPDRAKAFRQTLAAIGICYVIFLGVHSFKRGAVWRSAKVLFEDAVKQEPECGLARIQLGTVYAKEADRLRGDRDPQVRAQSASWSTQTVTHLSYALNCSDTYRYFAPLRIRFLLAREALFCGQPESARKALEGWLPPATCNDAPEGMLSKAEKARGVRLTKVGALYYRFSERTLWEAYWVAAEVEINAARKGGNVALADRKQAAVAALRYSEAAAQLDSSRTLAIILKATAHLLLFYYGEQSGDASEALLHYRAGKATLERVRSPSSHYRQARNMLESLKPPLGLQQNEPASEPSEDDQ